MLEALVSVVVLTVGVMVIALYFPRTLQTKLEAGHLARAVALANQKAQEIRRDNDAANRLISDIQSLTGPSPTGRFPEDDRLVYQFSGVSVLDPIDDPGDPRDDHGVARVIVRYATEFRPTHDVIYELQFGP